MSTANDMAKWMETLLNGGVVNGSQVIAREVIADSWKPKNVRSDPLDPRDIEKPRSVKQT